MAAADIWMPIYIGSFLGDTLHLSDDQVGSYLLLLLHGWRNQGQIPSDPDVQSRIARASTERWRINRPVIARFFEEVGGVWIQKRQIEEIGKANNRREASKNNGNKGGRPPNNLTETYRLNGSEPSDNLEANLEKSSSSSSSDPLKSPLPPKGKTIPSLGNRTLPEFASKVISYLNQKAKRAFRPTDAVERLIRARLREDFKPEDFRTVIDLKCAEWLGDPKMQKYLCPDTLFSNKFQKYLNQPAEGTGLNGQAVDEPYSPLL